MDIVEKVTCIFSRIEKLDPVHKWYILETGYGYSGIGLFFL